MCELRLALLLLHSPEIARELGDGTLRFCDPATIGNEGGDVASRAGDDDPNDLAISWSGRSNDNPVSPGLDEAATPLPLAVACDNRTFPFVSEIFVRMWFRGIGFTHLGGKDSKVLAFRSELDAGPLRL